MDNTTSLYDSRAFGLDDQKVTIIFGTLGTFISFSALVFAALTWYRSMGRQDTTHDNLPTEHELEAGIPKTDEDVNTNREHATLDLVIEGRVGDPGPGLRDEPHAIPEPTLDETLRLPSKSSPQRANKLAIACGTTPDH